MNLKLKINEEKLVKISNKKLLKALVNSGITYIQLVDLLTDTFERRSLNSRGDPISPMEFELELRKFKTALTGLDSYVRMQSNKGHEKES